MSLRAKFQVQSIRQHFTNVVTVELSCAYDMTIPEDQRFYDATPTGTITMVVNNPAAIEQLKLGEYFYVDFSPVPKVDVVKEKLATILQGTGVVGKEDEPNVH